MLTGMFGWRMTFNFFRLVVLLTTPALWRAGAGAAMAPLLAFLLWLPPGAAHAAQDNFNGADVAGCTRVANTYTCATLSQANDINIASGYTVQVSNPVSFTSNQVLKMGGSAVLHAIGDLNLSGLSTAGTQVAGGTLSSGATFRLGSNDQTVTANVSAAAIATGGSSSRINGNVTVKGQANLGSSTTITGTLSAATVAAGSSLRIDGGILASGTVSLSSATTIKGGIAGLADTNSGRSGAVTTGSGSSITGNIVASAFTLASGSTLAGDINAPTVELSAANAAVTGNITATTSLVVGSGGSVTGTIESPKVELNASNVVIKGDIKASTSLTISSGNTVHGNITGATLTIASANVVVNGNVKMTGDIDIGSNATINGDIAARNVTTHSSGDNLNGNVAVNAIFLDWGATVSKTITCTAPGASGCSCVTRADTNYKPTCGPAPPPSGVHHFRITHPGSALTCQPQPVTVTACANSDCKAPHYSGTATTVLQPGGKTFEFKEETVATVQQFGAGTATVSASGGLNQSTCVNTGDPARPCELVFDTKGLVVTVPNHVSMSDKVAVTIQALTASEKNQSCVPLVAGKTVDVDMACEYSNPSTNVAAVTPLVGDKSLNCGTNATKVGVPFTFDGAGVASLPLQYAEVGKVKLTASYTGSGGAAAGFNASGNVTFIAAPKSFVIDAVSTITGATLSKPETAKDGVFARASEAFTVKVTAVNAKGAPTRNFGKESPAENITLTAAVDNPDQKNPLDPRDHGAITAGTFTPFSGGATESVAGAGGLWRFSDVGTIRLDAALINKHYMGHAIDSFLTVGVRGVGRFIPDHFDTVLMTAAEVAAIPDARADARTMGCAGLAAAVKPCPDGIDSFINSKQPFFVKVLAYNGDQPRALTRNYTGPLARPVTLSAVKAAGASGDDVALQGAVLAWTGAATAARFGFSQGVGTPAAPAANLPLLRLPGAYPAVHLTPVTGYLRAVDSDAVTSLRRGSPAPASVEAGLTVVSGRLLIGNTYGTPTGSQPMGASAEYYMPVGYVFNPQVQLTSGTIAGVIKFDNCIKGLLNRCPEMKAAASPATLVLKSGKGTFRLAPLVPAPTEVGSADVSLEALIDYLPSSSGRATFGIYRSGPVIYRREVY